MIATSGEVGDSGGEWIWPHDQYDPILFRRNDHCLDLFKFEEPSHSHFLRRLAYLLNWIIYFRLGRSGHGTIIPVIPIEELAKLRAIPEDAGNILVGPHPGPLDPQLLFHLMTTVHNGPAIFLMAAESYYDGSTLKRALLNRLGVIPVARGRKNPEAVDCMVQHLARGWWGGIFPEGEVYFSRDVMPMEYGAVRIAIEAALNSQNATNHFHGSPLPRRGMFITPFAHSYFFANPIKAMHRAEYALNELESHPMVSVRQADGDLPTRLRCVADHLLENKSNEYNIPRGEWYHTDRFERTRRLQEAVLKQLEQRYVGRIGSAYVRRRAMHVRMICFERLGERKLPLQERRTIEQDIQKTRELILMTPFSRGYHEKYGDLEMWIEYLRRFRSALNLPPFDFGEQNVIFKISDPIDIHPLATTFKELTSEDRRLAYLYGRTEELRKTIQESVDEICSAHLTVKGPR